MSAAEAAKTSPESRFTEWEIGLLYELAVLSISETVTLNHIAEPGLDEAHLWRDRYGNIGVHIKRPSDYSTDQTVSSRLYFHFEPSGALKRFHLLSQEHLGSAEGPLVSTERARLTRLGVYSLEIIDRELASLDEYMNTVIRTPYNMPQAA